ncbi:sensor histidine kinase [Paenibacillus sp.]|uniref:sensor histidine kinase n=1 Tax=Paenibacillus sp. TaxID=58172 RepID=UPI002D285CB5|nr:sensor histidine kinase [Paenibacillus sp.]HZG58425.1 sensor histidine kinase [Paenibacillus sp.]
MFREWRLSRLLFVTLIGFSFFLVASTMVIVYFQVSRIIAEQTTSSRLELLEVAHSQLTARIRDVEETALSIAVHPALVKAVSEPPDSVIASLETRRETNEFVSRIIYSKAYITSIFVYSAAFENFPPLTQDRTKPLSAFPWGEETERLKKADSLWIGSRLDDSNLYRSYSVITYFSKIADERGNVVGYLEINVNETALSALLKENRHRTEGVTVILDSGGRLISNVSYPEGEPIEAALAQTSRIADIEPLQRAGWVSADIAGEPYLIVYTLPNQAQWRMLDMIPAKEVYGPLRIIRNWMIGVGILAGAIALAVALKLSRRITSGIPELLIGFRQIESGNFAWQLPGRTSIFEIQQLSKNFSRMSGQLQELMASLEREHQAKKQAEINALLSQINPHFLYNTLDMIHWMAVMKGAKEAGLMATKLARLFRINLSKGKTFITLAEELEHSLLYIEIQQARYKDRFAYRTNVDESLTRLYVPKLILQPFLENAIIHGLQDVDDPDAAIEVTVSLEGERLLLTVEDNGKGLIEPLPADGAGAPSAPVPTPSGSGGYGIGNVSARIRLYFGPAFGVEVTPRSPRGVCVRIALPIVRDADGGERYEQANTGGDRA